MTSSVLDGVNIRQDLGSVDLGERRHKGLGAELVESLTRGRLVLRCCYYRWCFNWPSCFLEIIHEWGEVDLWDGAGSSIEVY